MLAIGIFLGVCLVLVVEFYLDFFGDSLDPPETLAATLLGAGIALAGTIFAISASEEAERKKVFYREKAEALALFVKLREALNVVEKIRRHFLTNDPRVLVRLSRSEDIWKPLEFVEKPEQAAHSEIAVLLGRKKAILMDASMDTLSFSKIICDIAQRYRNDFYSLMGEGEPEKVNIEGRIIESKVTLSRTKLAELSATRDILLQMTGKEKSSKEKALRDYLKFLEEEFEIKIEVEISDEVSGHILLD